MIKKSLIAGLVLATTYGVLLILQLWFGIFGVELFFKISTTFAILGILDLIGIGIIFTIKENEELKKGNHIC